VIVVLLLLVLAALLAVGWVLSSRVIVPAPYSLMPEFEIVAVEPIQPGDPAALAVTLPVIADPKQHADTAVSGTYGLLWEGGYGLLGAVLDAGASGPEPSLSRALTLVEGAAPQPGEPARIDNFVYRRDPQQDFGIAFEELELAGEHGNLRAWYVPGEGRSSVLLLHGRRRGELIETLRMIKPLHELGLNVLALAYRNHDSSAPSDDGLYHYGASEWRDALVGARLLAERGSDRVILYGLSMGGAVALEALEHWTEAGAGPLPEPVALILDSPLVDPYATVELGAVKAGLPLPGPLTRLALAVAGWRTGADFKQLRQAQDATEVPVPVMVIAGVEDSTVPVASVDEFTAALRTPLTYHRLPGVEHVEAWNHDPETYAGWLRAFLASLEVRAEAP